MRTFFSIISLVITATTVLAQQQPMFLTKLYFEDAIGNRDTIEIGYDTAVTRENYPMESFGQVEVTSVWDSVFEVRAMISSHYVSIAIDQPWYKRVVSGAFFVHPVYGCRFETNASTLAIKSKYPPVTVSWEREDFTSNFCHLGGFIAQSRVANYYEGTSGPFWWSEHPAYLDSMRCMGEDKSWTPSLRVADPNELFVSSAYVTNGQGGTDSLFTLHTYLHFKGHISSPCDVELTVSTQSPSTPTSKERLLPNPVQHSAIFLDGKSRPFRVIDVTGVVRLRGTGSTLDLTSFEPGIYILESEGHSERFVKR